MPYNGDEGGFRLDKVFTMGQGTLQRVAFTVNVWTKCNGYNRTKIVINSFNVYSKFSSCSKVTALMMNFSCLQQCSTKCIHGLQQIPVLLQWENPTVMGKKAFVVATVIPLYPI